MSLESKSGKVNSVSPVVDRPETIRSIPVTEQPRVRDSVFSKHGVADLKGKSVRGSVVSMASQALKFVLRTGVMVIMARLLVPEDFGLVGMVAAVTGFIMVFRDAGLSMATVQRHEITHEQTSTLFWINIGLGALLAATLAGMAPLLVSFYHEPRLYRISIVMASTFLFSGLSIQHQALLQRQMRFTALAVCDNVSLAASAGVGIGMAMLGYRYWALVGMAVSATIVSVLCLWIAMPWKPGPPRSGAGVRPMLHFGGTITCNTLVVYLGYNVEKILLGRFCGADALGLYGRAFQLASLATEQLNSAISNVAFPAYSRLQNDAERLRRSFLKGYSIVLSLTTPAVICCALFAQEIILSLLGAKWVEAVPIFRLLTPMILALALINPFGCFLQATGRAGRSLKMAFLIAPVVILGVVLGLPYGTKGVAFGYSMAMVSLVAPVVAWAIHGTGITARDYWNAVRQPLLSSFVAGVAGLLLKFALDDTFTLIPRLLLGLGVVLGVTPACFSSSWGRKPSTWIWLTKYFDAIARRNCRQDLAEPDDYTQIEHWDAGLQRGGFSPARGGIDLAAGLHGL